MTQVDPESSLERLFGLLESHNSNLLDLLRATTAHEFITATESALERAMKTIENGSKEYSNLGERGLSLLCGSLIDIGTLHFGTEQPRWRISTTLPLLCSWLVTKPPRMK